MYILYTDILHNILSSRVRRRRRRRRQHVAWHVCYNSNRVGGVRLINTRTIPRFDNSAATHVILLCYVILHYVYRVLAQIIENIWCCTSTIIEK